MPAGALEVLGELPLWAQDVALLDGFAYVADAHSGLRVLDLSEGLPREVGSFDVGGTKSVAVTEEVVLLGGFDERLRFIDVSDPSHPAELASLEGIYATTIEMVGNLAYVGDRNSGLLIVDVRDGTNPVILGRAPRSDSRFPYDIEVASGIAYLAKGYGGLRIVDVSDPASPVELGTFVFGGDHTAVAIRGTIAYLIVGSDLWVLDVSTPSNPVSVARVPADHARDLVLSGDLLYAAHDGVLAIDVSDPIAPVTLGSLSTAGLALRIAVADGVAYLADNNRFHTVDLFDPKTPREIASLPTRGAASITGGFAYLVVNNRFNIYDVSDPSQPDLLSTLVLGSFDEIRVVGELAYLLSQLHGLQVWDVSDKTAPALLGRVEISGFVRDLEVQGDIAYVLNTRDGLLTVDVSDPHAPSILGSLETFSDPQRLAVQGDFVYVADNYSGIRVVDASDPTAPRLLNTIELIGQMTDVAAEGDLVYVVALRSGMQVLDVSDPLAPSVIAGPVFETAGALDIELEATLAYASGSPHGSIQVIDVSDPRSPLQRSGYFGRGYTYDSEVFDGIVYDLTNGAIVDFGSALRPPLEVGIDIDPRHETNRIRLGKRGVVPVAVLGSEEFDAATIDPETLSFGPNGAGPIGSHGGVRLDVNRDGFMDWVANFRIEETGIAFGEEKACIEGRSIDRRSVHGCDAIVTTLGCGHGFEMALAIPPLLWGGGRIRRRRR